MANHSLSKWKPVINLRVRSHLALALHLLDMLDVHFRGRVNYQKDLLFVLHAQDRVTNGAAHAMIEALAANGYLRIERWGPSKRYKRIIEIARPGDDAVRIREPKDELPWWATEYYAGPPNHREHLRRHLALAARFGWRRPG